jgi:prepilin-type N-terminal cleavage/methylation domain-containing protein
MKWKRNKTKSKGVTLIEVMIVVGLIGIVVVFVRGLLGYLNTIFFQTSAVTLQREAEVILYDISREVRNAKSIVNISSGSLVLRTVNGQLGYDSATSPIFLPVNLGTVTYQFVDATPGYLSRVREFPGQRIEKKYLKGLLIKPEGEHYMFRPMGLGIDPWSLSPPFDGVDVNLEIKVPAGRDPFKSYKTQVRKRTQSLQQ